MSKERILVVDDEVEVREVLRAALEQAGYEVSECANGKEAIEMLGARAYALVISDIFMPEKDGMWVSVFLTRNQPRVKMIGITGNPNPLFHESARKLGAVRVFTKPLNLAELLGVVREILDAPKSKGR